METFDPRTRSHGALAEELQRAAGSQNGELGDTFRGLQASRSQRLESGRERFGCVGELSPALGNAGAASANVRCPGLAVAIEHWTDAAQVLLELRGLGPHRNIN